MLQKSGVYKGISLFIKISIAVICLYYIYYKIFNRADFVSICNELKGVINRVGYQYVLLLLILMLFNWLLEAVKWKMIMKHLQYISFSKSFKAVLTGITISVFTPNRAGEFAGRIFFLKSENRTQAILLTFLGNTAQLLITIVTGAIALLFYLPEYTSINRQNAPYLYFMFIILIGIMAFVLLLAYFNIGFISAVTKKLKRLNKVQKYINVLDSYSVKELMQVILLSLLRYIIFTTQFYLLLKLFNVELNLGQGIVMIALTFLAISAIPTITITELGVRGSAALAFIGLLSENNFGIICASFSLWLINIAIPAIAGAVFVFQLNFFKNKV